MAQTAVSAITTLAQFYDAMFNTIEPRRRLVNAQLKGTPTDVNDIQVLKDTLAVLNAIPAGTGGKYAKRVKLDESSNIDFDVEYEVTELEKDLMYLEQGEYALLAHMESVHPNFRAHVSGAVEKLKSVKFGNLISDRDGTINNYCGRYLSSVQSVYNGVFLTRYAQRRVQNALVLTSAPLENKGLVDIACTPQQGAFIYSGSKGREVRTKTFERKVDAIPAEQQQKLDQFNENIALLLKQKSFSKYGLIGSALQFKTGNTTIARQDITKSVPAEESLAFLELIKALLKCIDPQEKTFRVEDTGLDVEVILTVQGEGALKDFDKGNGVEFLDKFVGLNLANSNNLVCGDTGSDLPMATASVKHAGKDKTWAVFVTKNEGLKQKVTAATGDNTVILDTPDELVVTLHELSKL